MTDLAIIILTKNESMHIGRCLEKIAVLEPRQVFVVDCFSTDGTQRIAMKLGATVVEHEWPGNQAEQFNWALDNLHIEASWVLRLDADEYLYPETINEVKGLLPKVSEKTVTVADLPEDITSLSLVRDCTFWKQPVHLGLGRVLLTRFFKYGFGRSDLRIMDEHIITLSGRDHLLKGRFIDDNLNGMDWWFQKHLDYANREAKAMIVGDMTGKKSFYAKLPLFWRAFLYFIYRYILRGGFWEGKAGFLWHFFQCLWYRMLVDAKIMELKQKK